jgi:hypothetical protein
MVNMRSVIAAVRADGASKSFNGPFDPPQVTNDILVTKKVQIITNLPATGAIKVSAAQIAAYTAVEPIDLRIRLLKISAWAPAGPGTRIRLIMSETNGDQAEYSDSGTQGSRRPNVHVRPSFLTSMDWRVGTSADAYCTIDNDGSALEEQCTIQVTVEMRQKAPSA